MDEFGINLTFDGDGKVRLIQYSDRMGCGHESLVLDHTTVGSLVRYHLDHYKESHEMAPRKSCPYTLSTEQGPLRCTEPEEFYHTKHVFEI